MGGVTLFEITLGIVFMLSTFRLNSANATDTGSGLAIAGEQVDGESLIRMGETLNSTLLKLLGRAFVNIDRDMKKKICEIDPCAQWSPWSNCTAKVEKTFGVRSRSRVCWLNKHDACNRTGEQTIENDDNFCEWRCPSSYTFYNSTSSCLKYFGEKRNQSVAENVCTQDGGHLLNTDTEGKWNAFVSIALSNNADQVWMDGTRTSVSAKWVYLNGKDPEENGVTSKWLSGEPSNSAPELCRLVHKSVGTYYWKDGVCFLVYNFICEVK